MTLSKPQIADISPWLVLLAALALRLALGGRFLLVPDEANYWQWSRHLALGYHDHPPMIAWLIHGCTSLLGHSELAVRLPTILGVTVASAYLCLLAGRWFGAACALQTALISQLVLLFNGSALIATPDGLLLPCWAAACYHAASAIERRSPGHWLITGLWFGLGMLSKYTMLLFLPCLFFYLLFSARDRDQLATPWPWIGLMLSLALFTPVLIWNAGHEWATFRHVLYQGGVDNKAMLTLRFVGDFLLTQVLLLSPVLVILVARGWWTACSGAPRADAARLRLLTWLSLLPFALFLLLSLHVRIYGNWPAPAYCTALILAAALFGTTPDHRRWWRATLWSGAVITLPVLIQVVYPILPLPIQIDRVARETTGWQDLSNQVDQARATMPRQDQTFVFGLRYQWASILAFYMPGRPETVSINRWTRPNVYDFWFDDEMLLGKDAVGIYEWKGMAEYLATLFERSDPVEEVVTHRQSPWFGSQQVQHFYLFRGYGFKGGIRWQPKDDGDIRATTEQTGR